METFITTMDQHGRVLIPSGIREMLHIQPGDKVNLENDCITLFLI